MGRHKTGFRLLFFCTILLFSFTFYGCGGGDESSSTNSFTRLSKINGHIMDVVVHNSQPKETVYAQLIKYLEIVKTANAQGLTLAGIRVVANQVVADELLFVDQDITDSAGGFTLDVPAAEIVLQFIIGDELFESTVNVPEETTVELFVNINADDPINPVEVSDMEMIDLAEDDTEENDNPPNNNQGNGNIIPTGFTPPSNNNNGGQGGQGGNPPNNNNDGGQGSDGGTPPDNNNDDGQSGQGGNPPDNNDDGGQGGGNEDPPGNDDNPVQGNGVINSSQVLSAINARRAQGADCGSQGVFGPQAPLSAHPALGQSALRHSDDMANLDFFSHTGSDGSSPFIRMNQAGFSGNAWGENILKTTFPLSADQVVAEWMISDGHCANIMNEIFSVMGSAVTGNGTWEYWTLDLAN